MGLLIVKPKSGEKAYAIAAETFRDMYERVTGISLPIVTEDDGVSDLILIGSDAVSDSVMELYLGGKTPAFGIRYGTDDYCIRSHEENERTMLILAGGRGRSTLYAVYDYFERVGGCHYFWDGDVIPHAESLRLTGLDVLESPRFEYRGLRYFAHRGLWRFQAEHWSLDDWKREIDWMVKRRLNFFMLRIGMDDLWQRTFPRDVPYPNPNETNDGKIGYNDRSPFWPLEYRGMLRQTLLSYAIERDLMHPEDCGTMSHWYSPAPTEFLEAEKPDFLTQTTTSYNNAQTLVWDIRKGRNMELYMKLTEGYVREYNPTASLFHTIGLAERRMSEDRAENMRMKFFAYRKIAQSLREKYPNSKLMLAGWDFFFSWTPEEVRMLLHELDPERTMILDYTAESDDPDNCFLNWGYVGKFPWIFGLFHAYEAESSLRGPYDRTDKRLRAAVDDPNCHGMVLWPELSHSDPLVLEYLTENAWSPLKMSIEQLTERYCHRRYGTLAETMNRAWQEALPLIKACDWGGNTAKKDGDPDSEKYITQWGVHRELWTDMRRTYSIMKNRHVMRHYVYKLNLYALQNKNAAETLRILAALPHEAWQNDFIRRDAVDLARTMVGRFMNYAVMKAAVLKFYKREDEIAPLRKTFEALQELLIPILGFHDDFSMTATLEKIAETCPINANFEMTLKRNLVNPYCRQYAYEPCKYLFHKDMTELFDYFENKNAPLPTKEEYDAASDAYLEVFFATPLASMRPCDDIPFTKALLTAANQLDDMDISVSVE